MDLIWQDAYSVGVAELDRQHQQILGVIRQLAGLRDVETRSEIIADLLDRLTRYGEEHFRAEEELLQAHGYPDLDDHVADHRNYRRTVAELCVATTIGVPTVPAALLSYARGWWVNHIQIEDQAYRQFLNDRGVS